MERIGARRGDRHEVRQLLLRGYEPLGQEGQGDGTRTASIGRQQVCVGRPASSGIRCLPRGHPGRLTSRPPGSAGIGQAGSGRNCSQPSQNGDPQRHRGVENRRARPERAVSLSPNDLCASGPVRRTARWPPVVLTHEHRTRRGRSSSAATDRFRTIRTLHADRRNRICATSPTKVAQPSLHLDTGALPGYGLRPRVDVSQWGPAAFLT